MSSMQARQKFLELKFDGNRRLAQEFVYIQDPSVTQLQKWQVWKKEAEAEERWTSWQTEDRAKSAIRKEPYRDPYLPRRKRRHRTRIATKQPYDVDREIELVESTEQIAWNAKVKQDKHTAMMKGLPPPPLPPPPPQLLAFAISEKDVKKYHKLEPKDQDYKKIIQKKGTKDGVITDQPGIDTKKKKKKIKTEVTTPIKIKPKGSEKTKVVSPPKIVNGKRVQEKSNGPSNLIYRFRMWWNGYYAATNVQRVVRGYLARQWVSIRIYEVRALIRRRSVYTIQRVYRGYLGRVRFRRTFIKLTSAALFIQRAYRTWSIVRSMEIRKRRHKAASKIQRSWYKLNSMLLAFRLLGMVRNKKDAMAEKDGFIAMYWGALRLQIVFKMNMARKKYRKRKALELRSCVLVQSFCRMLLVRKHVSKKLAAKFEQMHDNRDAAHKILRKFMISRLIGIRMKKAKILRYKSIVRLQAWQRGRSARQFDTRLRMQAALVRDWLNAFKQERVPALMNAEQAPNFYLQVEPLPATKKRAERHRRTGASDLPKPIREGPLFDHTAVPDYAAQARSEKASHQSSSTVASSNTSLASLDHNQPRHTAGVVIEETSQAHFDMLKEIQSPVGAITGANLSHGGSLDDVLEKRHRTISRGRPKSEGLSRPWDATIQEEDFMESFIENNSQSMDNIYNNDDNDDDDNQPMGNSLRRSRSANHQDNHKNISNHQTKKKEFGAFHVIIDKGNCKFKGSPSAKALDSRSKGLINAEDRTAYKGVANFANNRRLPRGKGDAKIMSDALDLIAQESRERGYLT